MSFNSFIKFLKFLLVFDFNFFNNFHFDWDFHNPLDFFDHLRAWNLFDHLLIHDAFRPRHLSHSTG